MAEEQQETERHLSSVPPSDHDDINDTERYRIAAEGFGDPGALLPDGTRENQAAVDAAREAAEQGELFPHGAIDGDPEITLGAILARYPVRMEVRIAGGKTGLKNGLSDPTQYGRAMVVHEVAKWEVIPEREGEDREIVGLVLRQHLRQTHVENLDSAKADPATGLAA